MICTALVAKASVEMLTLDPTDISIGGTFDSVTVASVELVVMEAVTQLVVSTPEFGFG
jgi:hypothetical protein